jgi:hypothetical protein
LIREGDLSNRSRYYPRADRSATAMPVAPHDRGVRVSGRTGRQIGSQINRKRDAFAVSVSTHQWRLTISGGTKKLQSNPRQAKRHKLSAGQPRQMKRSARHPSGAVQAHALPSPRLFVSTSHFIGSSQQTSSVKWKDNQADSQKRRSKYEKDRNNHRDGVCAVRTGGNDGAGQEQVP